MLELAQSCFFIGICILTSRVLAKLNPKLDYFAKDLKNMWPLNYYFFEDWHLKAMLGGGNLGMFMLFFGIGMIFLISPILTYFLAKDGIALGFCGLRGIGRNSG